MLRAFPGYQVLELRVSTGTCCYWRARRDEDQREVLLKSRRMGNAQHKAHALALEYERRRSIESPYLPQTIDACLDAPDPFLVFEALAGHQPVSLRVEQKALTSAEVTELGLHMTRALMAFHQRDLCCLSMNPDVIWVDENFSRCVLMDLANTTSIGVFAPEITSCYELQASLSYIAPEQTGRLREPLDERSDLYVLGLVLHCATRGKPPYAHHRSVHSLIHAQLTEVPPELPPHGVAPALRGIVSKLCEKSQRDRYQSCEGLLYDLKKTRKEIAFNRNLDFPAGQFDRPLRFDPSPKLYERSQEQAKLRDAIERCARGQASYVNLQGEAGVGKSALLASVMPDFTRHQMLVVTGRCQQEVQGQNYGAIAQIIRTLIASANALPPHLRREQKLRTKRALGGRVGLLVDIIPEIEKFLGPSAEPLGGFLKQQRQRACLLAMQQCILSFACHHQPLVLHFDNLQWADYKTTSMIHGLLADPQARYMLIIGSVRQDLDFSPISGWAQTLIKSGIPFVTIQLRGLSLQATQAFVTESLSTHASVLAIVKDLHDKTQGKPTLLSEHLRYLHDRGRFFFDDKARRWKVKEAKPDLNHAGTQATILDQRLSGLDQELQTTLRACALLGVHLHPSNLSASLDIDQEQATDRLHALVRSGFLCISLRPWRGNAIATNAAGELSIYRFAKDQVKDHLLKPSHALTELRIELSSRLLRHKELSSSAPLKQCLLALAYPCLDALRSLPGAPELSCIIYQEAMRAFACTAYDRAEHLAKAYLRLSQERLGELADEFWTLGIARLFAAQVTGDDELYAKLHPHIVSISDRSERRIERLEVEIIRAAAQSSPEETLDLLLKLSNEVGHPIDPQPSSFATKTKFARWHMWLSPKKVDALLTGPALREPQLLRFLDALAIGTKSAFITDQPNLYIALISKALEITFQHGLSSAASAFFSHVALVSLSRSQDLANADRMFDLATQTLKSLPHRHYQANLVFMDALYRVHLKRGLAGTRAEMMRAHRIAHEAGDDWTATHCISQSAIFSCWMGDSLDSLRDRANQVYRYASQTKVDNVVQVAEGWRYNLSRLLDPQLPEKSILAFAQSGPSSFANNAFCLCHDITFAMFFGELDRAWELSQSVEPYLHNLEGLVPELMVAFYRCLMAFHFYQDPERRARALSILEDSRGRLSRWHQHNPEAAQPFVLLIQSIYQGEVARRPSDEDTSLVQALSKLDHAIFELESLGYFHLAALASIWGVRWSKTLDLSARSELYAKRVAGYRTQWGVSPSFPCDTFRSKAPSPTRKERSLSTLDNPQIGRSQGISYELLMQSCAIATRVCSPADRIRDFLELIRETLLADRIVVILDASIEVGAENSFPGTKGLVEFARSGFDYKEQTTTYEQRELCEETLPVGLIYRCAEENEPLLLDCVQESSYFTQSTYLRKQNPTSLLAVPLPGHRNAIGVIYIESISQTQSLGEQNLLQIQLMGRAIGASMLGNARQQRSNRRIQELETQLQASNAKAQQAGKERKRISTLLTTVQGHLQASIETLQDSADLVQGQCQETGQALNASIRRIRSTFLTIDELTASRINGPDTQSKPFSLALVIDKICARAQAMSKRKGAQLSIQTDFQRSKLQVFGDKKQSERAICLLLEFATDKVRAQEIELHVQADLSPDSSTLIWTTQVKLPCQPESPDGRIDFLDLPCDSGDEAGLGGMLVRARQLVTMLGGHMEIEPYPDGVCLSAVLVLEPCQDSVARKPLILAPPVQQPQQRKALIVADDLQLCDVLVKLLAMHEFETVIVTSGLEAIQCFQQDPLSFQVVLMSTNLPAMSGYQAAAHIRAGLPKHAAHLPIFAISSPGSPDDVDRCLAAGMDEYLELPVQIQSLAEALAHWDLLSPSADLKIAS